MTQITRTFYDEADAQTPSQLTPKNLRGIIAAVKVFEDGQTTGAATFYDYDIHGNVEKLVQSLPELEPKTVEYDYDLLSGNIHRVTYQKGETDQFMHRYAYDADNRLEAVFTSSDGYIWDEDARYMYYAHGPMARVELGEYKVQGMDYYYTLQGWIKGVNLQGDHDAEATNNIQKYVSKDAFGYALHYYQNDYQSINGNFGWNSSNTSQYKNLYNGNIASMKTTLSSLGELVRDYKYDQLHRIREANSLGNAYKETFTYDANGNIKTNTLHNSEGNQVDNATYHYFAETNKLHYISDSYGETQAGFDLMNQNVGNFAYDLIGNLVKDKAMDVSQISWTAYHKRSEVIKEDGTTITYRYDAMNNRIYKKAEGNGVTETTHYLRDGSGNTLAIYKNGELEELNIYGSSRLGSYNGKTDKGKRTLGNKRYELSNHLGNALVVITDNKIGKDLDNDQIADTYIAMVVSERDYLAFGAVMHKRSYENESYTYSFNGKELDPSTGWQDYGFRDYNPVYKRFDRVDPLTFSYPELTPYQFASNRPISGSDLDGLEYDDRTEVEIELNLFQISVAQTIASIPRGFVRGIMNVFMMVTGSNRRYHHKKGGGYWEFEGINREELDINDPDYLEKAGAQVLSDVGDIATVATGGSSKGMPSGSVFAKTGGKKVAANEVKKAADGITDGLSGNYSGQLVKNNKPDEAADALAKEIGGESRVSFSNDPAKREFDVISDEFIAQTKAINSVGSSFRKQAKATFEAAKETGRKVFYRFEKTPDEAILKKIEEYSKRYNVEVKTEVID